MSLTHLADEIAGLRRLIVDSLAGVPLDKFEHAAFAFVVGRLSDMESECRTGKLKPAETRYPELGRVAEEANPAVLSPDLGGRLVEVERMYQKA